MDTPSLDSNSDTHPGGCLCGNIRYVATGHPVVVAHCHCEDCQRISGAGHTTGAMFATTHFEISGNFAEYTLVSSAGNQVTKVFCPTCGSPILGKNDGMEGFVTVSLGTMDDSSGFDPEVVIFANNRKPWDIMSDTLATFPEQPKWSPENTR